MILSPAFIQSIARMLGYGNQGSLGPAPAPVAPKPPTVSAPFSTGDGFLGENTPTNPSVPAMGGMGLFPGAQPQPMNWLKMAQYNAPPQPAAATPTPAPQAPVAGGVPLPQARPAGAPQAPAPSPMSFFQRNAAMMRDPTTGAFIDPTAAAQASNGSNLITKMIGYLKNKDLSSNA